MNNGTKKTPAKSTYNIFRGRFDPQQIRLKSDQTLKKSKSDFVTEYPIWVSIKRTLTGKLALDGQNLISCFRFEENVQKPHKKADSWKCANLDGFWMIYPHGDFGFFIRLWRYDRGSNTLFLSTDIVYFGET